MIFASMASLLMYMHSVTSPVKMSLLVLLYAFIVLISLQMETGNWWFSCILLLMFTGGVLMMFMMLSTFHPGAEEKKFSLPKLTLIALITATVLLETKSPSASLGIQAPKVVKILFEEYSTSLVAMILIVVYFLSMMFITLKSENPMRSNTCLCQKSGSLVNSSGKSWQFST